MGRDDTPYVPPPYVPPPSVGPAPQRDPGWELPPTYQPGWWGTGGSASPSADAPDDGGPGWNVQIGDSGSLIITPDDTSSPGSYSSNRRSDYDAASLWITNQFDHVSSRAANSYVAEQGYLFFLRHGRWPASWELLQDADFFNGAASLQTNLDMLPPLIRTDDGVYSNTGYGLQLLGQDAILKLATSGQLDSAVYISSDVLAQILKPPSSGGGGGGGGGGGSRFATPVFDRDEVVEAIRNEWRGLMLEEPEADALADKYISESKQFAQEGGRINLQVWTRNQARSTARYSLLYAKKPDDMTEDQYLGGYVATVSQFGLRNNRRLTEIEAGATSGAGLAGFQQRVSKIRPVATANQGAFSQQLASTIGGLGALARS